MSNNVFNQFINQYNRRLIMKRFNIITTIAAIILLTIASATLVAESRMGSRQAPLTVKLKDTHVQPLMKGASNGCDNYYYYDDTATTLAEFTIPNQYGDDFYNTRFSVEPARSCTLGMARIALDGGWMTGTPGIMRVYLWNDDGSGFPGSKLDSVDIPYTLLPAAFGWVDADFSAGNHIFSDGEEFHIGWTMIGGTGDTLCGISDLATGPHTGEERSSVYYNGAWYPMYQLWNIDYGFLIEAEMCCGPVPTGVVSVSLSGSGAGTGGTIICGAPVIFNIHFNNNSSTTVTGSSNGFRLYSPESATWLPPTYTSTGALELYYDGGVFMNGFGADGTDDDTIGIAGVCISGTGLPVGFDDDVMSIETQLDCSHEGKTLCIDSTWYPPSNTWLWVLGAGSGASYVSPHWGGPYCYETTNPCMLGASAISLDHGLIGRDD
jgi:hypothetical protein